MNGTIMLTVRVRKDEGVLSVSVTSRLADNLVRDRRINARQSHQFAPGHYFSWRIIDGSIFFNHESATPGGPLLSQPENELRVVRGGEFYLVATGEPSLGLGLGWESVPPAFGERT